MLNMTPVVQVNVSVGASSKVATVFDIGAILTPESGTGASLGTTRFAVYSDLSEMLSGVSGEKPAFASTTETYKAAEKYFGVSPAPRALMVIYYASNPEAPEYSASATYAVGDFCTHEGKIYSCNTAIASGEAWNAAHWDEYPMTDETPVTAIADAIGKGAEFYGVYYIAKPNETAANIRTYIVGIASALEGISRGVVFYGVTGTAASVTAVDSLLSAMHSSATKRAIGMTCTELESDAAGLMGIGMGYAATARDRAFALCYKGIATATANTYSQSEVDAIKAVNGNVFVARTKAGAKVENGATASGLRFDEVLYIDMIASDIQESLYDLIANSTTKLPQTDSTTSLFIGEIYQILERYYNSGVLADSAWRGTPVRSINTGDVLEHGYIAFADSFDQQSEDDRKAHKAMPITVLICLSGSVESIVINLDVQT